MPKNYKKLGTRYYNANGETSLFNSQHNIVNYYISKFYICFYGMSDLYNIKQIIYINSYF